MKVRDRERSERGERCEKFKRNIERLTTSIAFEFERGEVRKGKKKVRGGGGSDYEID